MFAAETMTSSVTEMWRFLSRLYSELPWLSHFFVDQRGYVEGIRSYKAIASFIELGTRLARDESNLGIGNASALVAPIFLVDPRDLREPPSIASILTKAVPDAETLNLICDATGCTAMSMRDAWPAWYRMLVQDLGQLYRDTYFGRNASSYRDPPPPLPR
jgi:hypothetical protein